MPPQTVFGPFQQEMAWAVVFLRALQEAEGELDHLRLHGLGVTWQPDRTPQERDALLAKWPAGHSAFKR